MAKLVSFVQVGRGAKLVRVHKVTLTRSQPKPEGKGNELMVKLQLKVKEGAYEGETLFTQAMLEGKGAFFGTQTLSAIRPDIDWRDFDAAENPDGTINMKETEALLREELEDQDAIAVVKHSPDRNNPALTRSEVARMLAEDADVQLEDDAEDEAA